MADGKHLDLLKQGVATWNDWRRSNPSVVPDLSGANLVKADLKGSDLSQANLEGANLTRAVLDEADLHGARLRTARLLEVELSRANLCDADLSEAQLVGSKLIGSNLDNTNFTRAQIAVANFKEASLRNADLREADLRESVLVAADLSGAKLAKTLLLGARLQGAKLRGAFGLEPDQLEGIHIDQSTELPGESLDPVDKQQVTTDVYRFLQTLKEKTSGQESIEERFVFELHGALKRLADAGHDVSGLEFPESALSQEVSSFEHTSGGGFETEPSRQISGPLFHGRLDQILGLFAPGGASFGK